MTPLDLERQLQQHGSALRGLARGLVRDHHAADDLVQATLACALDRPPARPGPAGGWLATVLRRLHLQRRRTESRRIQRERAAARSERLPSTIDQVERRETLQAVTTALFALDEPYQTTLLLRYVEDLTPSAIAARTGASVATVKSRLQRGLSLLRGRLDAVLGDRQRWTRALCAGTGLPFLASTTILGTGALLMGTTTKIALGGAAALLLGALAWTLLDQEPPPLQPTATMVESATAAAAVAAPGEAAAPADPDRVALAEAAADTAALLHPFAYELEVVVQDRLGLPVEGARVLLAPPGCRLDEVAERTDGSGTVSIRWRGRRASMPIVVATGSDETHDAMREVVVSAGSRARVVLGGSGRSGMTVRLIGNGGGGNQRVSLSFGRVESALPRRLAVALDGLVLQQGSFADNPHLRDGLHPFASFGDVQWRQRADSDSQQIEVGGLQGLTFTIHAADLQIVQGEDETVPPEARVVGVVYDEDGEPCARCPVAWGQEVDRPTQRTETDDRGAYRFDAVPEGAFELRAGGSDAGLQHLSITTMRGQTTTADLHLRRQGSVRGRAVAADGKPLAGWRVEWVGVQMPWFDAGTVADDGGFVLPNLPGGSGRLLLWRNDGNTRLPALHTSDVLPDNGEVELRFDAATAEGRLQLEPALPDGIDEAAIEARIFQEDTGRGTTLHKAKDGNQFAIAGLAAGWYRLELGGPGLGWIDAGRHFVDGQSLVDLGRLLLPRTGSLRLDLPPDTAIGAVDEQGAFALEIYRRRDDCDVRLEDPATVSVSEALPLPAGDYFALWRSPKGEQGFAPFTVRAGREVEVQVGPPR